MTETESMVVRVAKAICAEDDKNIRGDGIGWNEAKAFARAAIEAMRECDNDMLEAMHSAMFEDEFTGRELPMLNAGWVAALDKALEE